MWNIIFQLADCGIKTDYTAEIRNDTNGLLYTIHNFCNSSHCVLDIPVSQFNSTFYTVFIMASNSFNTTTFTSNISELLWCLLCHLWCLFIDTLSWLLCLGSSPGYYLDHSVKIADCALDVSCSPAMEDGLCTVGYYTDVSRSSPVMIADNSTTISNFQYGTTYFITLNATYKNTKIFWNTKYTNSKL